MGDVALMTAGLSRKFGSNWVVSDLDLRVEVGDVYGFLGPNGAGKTTAIRCILGLLRPSRGEVTIFGEADRVRQRRHVGAMVETPAFHRWLSGLNNLRHAAAFAGQGGDTATLMAAIERVGLRGRENDPVGSYSLGMRQRLGIARALIGKPRLLVLDEPTNGLDPRGMKEVRDLLLGLARDEQLTIFISSHLLGEVEQLCSRVGIIEKGRLIAEGTPEELTASRQTVLDVGATDLVSLERALRSMPLVSVLGEGDVGRLRIGLDGATTPAALNRALVEAGVAVDALVPIRESLESMFLSLTSEELT
ncbi:MAG: ABC transporter ATP-binding protein [Myxococcota bacterium]